jgi:ankyrin repeat protein
MARGADPNLISQDGHTPLDFAVSQSTPNAQAIVELLLSSGALLTHSNTLHNALNIPSDDDCIAMMEYLLEKGVDVNALSFTNQPSFQSRNCGTALHWAVKRHGARRGRQNMLLRVKWLLDHGADVGIRDSSGKLPIDAVTDEALVKLLRENEGLVS